MKGALYHTNIMDSRKTREKIRRTNEQLEYSISKQKDKLPKFSRVLNFYQKFYRQMVSLRKQKKSVSVKKILEICG